MISAKQKKWIIIVSSILAVILLAAIIMVCVLFVPLNGKKHVELWTGSNQAYDINKDSIVLEKEPGEDFVITQLTDMQLWMSGKDNKKAFEVAEKVIDQTEPDLVVLTGDNVSGAFIPGKLKQIIEFFEAQAKEHDFYWATIFGNHDNELKTTPNWQGDQYLKASIDNGGRCLFRKGPSNLGDSFGPVLGNYVINIQENGKIVQSLYMLDNSTYADYPQDLIDKVGRGNAERPMTYAQIEWCKWHATNINKIAGKTVPSMFFTHFAPYEMGDSLRAYVAGADGKINTTDDIKPNSDEIYWKLSNEEGQKVNGKDFRGVDGRFTYIPGHALYNTGMVDAMKGLGLKGWFVGHDHENDVVFEYDGVTYGYGLKVGPSPKPWNSTAFFGGTKIVMDNDGKITTSHIITDKADDYWSKR